MPVFFNIQVLMKSVCVSNWNTTSNTEEGSEVHSPPTHRGASDVGFNTFYSNLCLWEKEKKGIHPHSRIWLNHEKEWSPDTGYHVDGPWTHDAQWEKPDTEGHTVCDSIDRKCPDQAKRDIKEICGCLGIKRMGEELREWVLDGYRLFFAGWWKCPGIW